MDTAITWKTVWIVGASSGIGRQFAVDLAERGCHVCVSARSEKPLNELAQDNPNIDAYPLDVTDADAVSATAQQIISAHGLPDLVITAAGIWIIREVRDFSAADARMAMRVNYEGTVNVIETVLPQMIERGSGHIAPVASVAGYRGIPRAVTYAPTKAALISMAEALRTDADRYGVKVQIVNPGFVKTPMTDSNDFPMPFIITAEEASCSIIKGLQSDKFEIVFPKRLGLIMKLLRILPYSVYFWLAKRFMQRG